MIIVIVVVALDRFQVRAAEGLHTSQKQHLVTVCKTSPTESSPIIQCRGQKNELALTSAER